MSDITWNGEMIKEIVTISKTDHALYIYFEYIYFSQWRENLQE